MNQSPIATLPTRRIAVHGLHLNVLDEGEGEAVLLIHGFPDSHRVWRHQIPALLEAGWRVIAPDLRGFGASDRPEGVEAYGLMQSVQDLIALLDHLGVGRAHVVCHDFGAAVGWLLAASQPQRVISLVAMSVGHLNAMRLAGPDQRAMSWYMLLFQFEELAEQLLERQDWALLRDWGGHHPEVEQWISDLSRPGALTAALNWYRANQHPRRWLDAPAMVPPVAVPTLSMWSTGDVYLGEAQVVRTPEFVTGPWRYERLVGAGHWLQLDRPAEVTRLLLGFLADTRNAPAPAPTEAEAQEATA